MTATIIQAIVSSVAILMVVRWWSQERQAVAEAHRNEIDRLIERIQRPETVVPLADYPASAPAVPFEDDETELEVLNDRIF